MADRRSRKRTRLVSASPEHIGAVLLRASPDHGAERGAPLPPRAWHDAVGDRIARRTRPVRLERKMLTVRAATSVWAQELSFLAPTILARLCALGWEIESLRFLVGPIEAPPRPPKPPAVKWVPPARPLPPDLSRAIAAIEEPTLRSTIARAATANLAWQAAAALPTSTRPSARGLRSAGRETAPPDQTRSKPRGAGRHTP